LIGFALALLVVFRANVGWEAGVSAALNSTRATSGIIVLIATAAITARKNIPQSTAPICCRQFIDTECQLARMKILLLTGVEVGVGADRSQTAPMSANGT
jgi:hypothetical protein